jgi:hypothetical protein
MEHDLASQGREQMQGLHVAVVANQIAYCGSHPQIQWPGKSNMHSMSYHGRKTPTHGDQVLLFQGYLATNRHLVQCSGAAADGANYSRPVEISASTGGRRHEQSHASDYLHALEHLERKV